MLTAARKLFVTFVSNKRLVWLSCALLATCAVSLLSRWATRPDYVIERHLPIVSQTDTHVIFNLPPSGVAPRNNFGRPYPHLNGSVHKQHFYVLNGTRHLNDFRVRLVGNMLVIRSYSFDPIPSPRSSPLEILRPRGSTWRYEVTRVEMSGFVIPGWKDFRYERQVSWISDVITNANEVGSWR